MDKWAIITGGGQGIGAALVLNLSQHGYHILAVDINLQPLETLLTDHPAKGLVHTIKGDVTTEEIIDKVSTYIPVDNEIKFFIPCQRVGYLARIEDLKMAEFENAMKVHVVSPLFLAQRLIPRLNRCNGRILLTITPVEAFPQIGWACYGITKTAFYKLGQQLKMELKGSGVSVGCADPGIVNTEGFQTELKKMKEGSIDSEATLNQIEQAKDNGFLFESNFSAKFLSYLLLEVSEDEFISNDWKAVDKSHWDKWNK